MKLPLSDIPDEGFDFEFREILESNLFKLLSPVRALLRIDRCGSEVFIKGTLLFELELQCSRCLKVFAADSSVGLNAVYHPIEELRGEEKHELIKDEMDLDFYKNDELDIDELLKEQIILSIPMQPLCSETCRGICPECGADLSIDVCQCKHKEIDQRFAVLKTLLPNRKE